MFDGNIRLATRVVDACPVRMAIRYGLILVSLAGPFFTGSPSQAQTVPTVSFTIAAQSAPENSGSTVVTAALSVVTTVDVTVPYTLSGTALNPQDFTISPNTIVIPAGNLTADATVTIINDVLYELDETIVVTMGTPVNANPGAITTEVVTILDNDPAPTIDVNNATVSEGAGVAVFTVSLSALSGRTISVDYATADNTAIAGLDYTAAGPQTLTFAPGETSKDVWISIFDDLLSEGSESFQFNLSNPVAAALGVATGIGTILDNDALPVVDFTSGSQSAVESAGTLTITAMLSTVSGQTVRVPFTVGGTASNPADYAISASPIIIPAGSSSGTITISLTDDLLDEADETIVVTMGSPINAVQGTTTVHTATITDNDAPPSVGFTAPSQDAVESAGAVTVGVQLSAVSGQDVTVPFTVSGSASNPADYSITASPVVIPAGSVSATVTITIVDDPIDEPGETVVVTMGTPVNAVAGPIGTHTATILDNDNPPGLSITDPAVAENGGPASFTVSLSAASGFVVTVTWFTTNGTATAGSDYQTVPVTVLTFQPGETAKPVLVNIIDDTTNETTEFFTVTLNNATNASISKATGSATITDDDPLPALSIADLSVPEGLGTASFIVSIDRASSQTITVNYATANGTAIAGLDYTAVTLGQQTFSPGQTVRLVTVPILDDSLIESPETFNVNLSGTVNSTIADGTAVGTITDNDAFYPSDFSRYADISVESGDPVNQFYSVGITINTSSLIASGQVKTDGSDLVVAWDASGTGNWIEIDAHPRPVTYQTLATSTLTQIWFAIQEPAGIHAFPYANRYRLYYGNPLAVPSVRRRNGKLVYRFFDDFNGAAYDSSVWYVHPSYKPAVSVSGGMLHQDGALSPGAIWQGSPIRMTSQTAAYIPTFGVSYAQPWAGECRFRSLNLGDDVRPVNTLQHMPPPGFPTDHDEYATFLHNNGTQSIRLVKVSNGVGSGLVNNPTVILANTWYDLKTTARQTVTTPGSERALHQIYLNGGLLGDSATAFKGGYDSTITSGTVGIETDPGSKGDYDWFLIRDYTANEPLQSVDPYVNLKVRQVPGGTELDWSDPGGALSWDVIRGQIEFIVENSTIVDLGPVVCMENDSPDTTTAPDHLEATLPAPGKSFFYLVRTRTPIDVGIYGHSTKSHKEVPSNGDCF